MNVIAVKFLGRFGNQCVQYLYARAWAEKYGCQLQTEPWIGQKIFEIDDPQIAQGLPRRSELDVTEGEVNIEFRGYAQMQRCMIYTRRDAIKWLRFRPHLLSNLTPYASNRVMAHRRLGDYFGYGYPVVSHESYIAAAKKYLCPEPTFVSEETAVVDSNFTGELKMLPDFYRLMTASSLFRANSTFSWLAGLLGNGNVYSPIINGKVGGQEHDCEFVAGNHPKFANLAFVEDLHVAE